MCPHLGYAARVLLALSLSAPISITWPGHYWHSFCLFPSRTRCSAQPLAFRILDQRGNAELRASLGKGSGKAVQGLRLDNGKDNDIQKRNLPFLLKKLIVLAIVQSEREIYICVYVYISLSLSLSYVSLSVLARCVRSSCSRRVRAWISSFSSNLPI